MFNNFLTVAACNAAILVRDSRSTTGMLTLFLFQQFPFGPDPICIGVIWRWQLQALQQCMAAMTSQALRDI